MHDAPAETHDGDHAESHLPTYKRVILVLALLTAVEFFIAWTMHHGVPFAVGLIALVALAAWKAVLVARFFMHLRYDPGILAFIAFLPVILASPIVLLVGFDLHAGPNL